MKNQLKDSAENWTSQIPVGWKIVKLKSLFVYGKGLSITKKNLLASGIPVISYGQIHAKDNTGVCVLPELYRYVSSDYLESSPESLVQRGDFIIADTSEDLAGCGNCVYVDTDGQLFAGYHTIILRSKKEINNKYIAYLFLTDSWRDQIRSKVSGIKVYSITKDILMNTFVIVPPKKEQMRIVQYLDGRYVKINSIIKNTRASIEEYKQLKQAIITRATTRGLRKDQSLKDSGIDWVRQLPSSWKVIPAKYLFCDSVSKREENDEQLTASQKYGIISQGNYMRLQNTKIVIANQGLENWKHVDPENFVMSLRSFQGGIEMSEVTGCITWHYVVLKACKPIYSRFYKWLFKSEPYINALQRTCNFIRDGQDLRFSNFAKVPLYIPPLEEQKEIADYLDNACAKIDELITKKNQLLSELEAYKQSLIYEYVTGKKDVV